MPEDKIRDNKEAEEEFEDFKNQLNDADDKSNEQEKPTFEPFEIEETHIEPEQTPAEPQEDLIEQIKAKQEVEPEQSNETADDQIEHDPFKADDDNELDPLSDDEDSVDHDPSPAIHLSPKELEKVEETLEEVTKGEELPEKAIWQLYE